MSSEGITKRIRLCLFFLYDGLRGGVVGIGYPFCWRKQDPSELYIPFAGASHQTRKKKREPQKVNFLCSHSFFLVIPSGFEPETHSLEGCCSIQLSYGTIIFMLLLPKAAQRYNLLLNFQNSCKRFAGTVQEC